MLCIYLGSITHPGLKTIAIVRKEDAMQNMKDRGASKVLVLGDVKSADEYTKAIIDATDGEYVLSLFYVFHCTPFYLILLVL